MSSEEYKPSFAEQHALKQTICVFMVRGYAADGNLYFCYVAIPGDKLAAFKKAMDAKSGLDVEQFGVILEWGQGDPSPEVMKRMQDEYGFKHENMIDVSTPN